MSVLSWIPVFAGMSGDVAPRLRGAQEMFF